MVLQRKDAALQAFYADPDTVSDPKAAVVLSNAMANHSSPLLAWLDHPPQTNEVRRSVVLIAAAHWLTARLGLPLVLSELGASAGLNLIWDRYALDLGGQIYGARDPALTLSPEWRGPLPPVSPPEIAARAGVDLNPLHPATDRLSLMAYTWPDQQDRLDRLALALTEAATNPPPVARADAIDWLETRLSLPHPGTLHLVYHTIAWQYFPAASQARGRKLLAQAGAKATPDTPLAHLSMEADDTPGSAALTLTLWPGGQALVLGRADFHGRWVDWQAPPPDASLACRPSL